MMKLKRIEVQGLNKRVDVNEDFHDDVNVLTGVNGSGKTSLLKLMWYIVSGNTLRLRHEVSFRRCYMETDTFSLLLERQGGDISFTFKRADDLFEASGLFDDMHHDSDGDLISDGEDYLRDLIRDVPNCSVFFPTFRRIEGGYSISVSRRGGIGVVRRNAAIPESNLSEQMQQLSARMSSGQHKFVCSISTEDISALLTERYAQISEGVNKSYTEFSRTILSSIRNWERGDAETEESRKLLINIQSLARDIEDTREVSFKPFSVLSELVAKLFNFQGVKLRNLALGDAAKAIDSEILSAGEKQMLSFLVYNAFTVNAPIFIDEPELSLHPDWQRRLLPALLEQQASNQFIVSTHSPFIYSKYSDKEIRVSMSRGDADELE